MKAKNTAKNILCSLAIPVIVYVCFRVLCALRGVSGYGTGADLQTMIYTSVYSGLIALAMAVNLTSGRFDFSIGATMVLAIIFGGNIAKSMGLSGVLFLLVVVLTGLCIGAISGLTYVLLKLPPMVVSLGLAMIYEAAGFMLNKAKGVNLIGKNDMLIFASFPVNVILMAVVLVVTVILWDKTQFGYNRKALAGGQKVTTDVGINEKKNAVACYMISGALLGVAGCVYISKFGTVTPETGLSSSTYFMTAFLPMFIGNAIGKYSSVPLGVFIGAVTQAFITSGFGKLGLSSSLQTVMNGVIVMLFLIYVSNSHLLVEQKLFKEKLERARAARAVAETEVPRGKT